MKTSLVSYYCAAFDTVIGFTDHTGIHVTLWSNIKAGNSIRFGNAWGQFQDLTKVREHVNAEAIKVE